MNHVDRLLANAGLHPVLSPNQALRSRVMRIGPKEAAALLAANNDNRSIRPSRIDYYAKVMQQGGWRLTHQGIAFCVDGRGLDLQHRLNAIIKANVTVDIMVTEGLSPDAFEAIDQHERRSAADALRVDRPLADVARMLLLARGGHGCASPTILEIGEASSAVEHLHSQIMASCSSRRVLFTSAPVRAAAMILMDEKPSIASQVLHNYRILALAHSEEWPRVMHALNRQFTKGLIGSGGYGSRMDLLVRALAALDPARAHLSKIQVPDEAIVSARRRAARLIGMPAQATAVDEKPRGKGSRKEAFSELY